jgi:hypothetical protein
MTPLGSIRLRHRLRSQARVDRRLLHRRERVVVGMVRTAAGLPARGVEVKLPPPDPRHRPQSSRVQHRCPGCARQYHAGRAGVPCRRRLGSYHQPAATGGLGGNTGVRPGRPQPGLEAVATVLHVPNGWSRATRHTYHNERHPIGLLTICSSRPLPGSAPAWVRASRCPTHRLWGP